MEVEYVKCLSAESSVAKLSKEIKGQVVNLLMFSRPPPVGSVVVALTDDGGFYSKLMLIRRLKSVFGRSQNVVSR